MKPLNNLNLQKLNRDELSKIKAGGGTSCTTVYESCDPQCGHFSSDYSTFAKCVNSYNDMCSPLGGWGTTCGNFN